MEAELRMPGLLMGSPASQSRPGMSSMLTEAKASGRRQGDVTDVKAVSLEVGEEKLDRR